MNKSVLAVLCALLIASASAWSEVDKAVEKRIRDSLQGLLPNAVPENVRATPIKGLYEVTFGTRLIYLTGDGRFLLQGSLIDLETRTELTAQRLSALRLSALDKVGEDRMVIFGPEDAKHTVTVFTDIDCGYCRKMHADMAQYNDQGIRIRYLFYPRAGVDSDSYDKAVSVWCAEDRNAAMDIAKAGQPVEKRSCDNPVAEHHALGEALRLRGTPLLVLQDGYEVPGYVSADRLRTLLDQRRAMSGG